MNNINSLIVEGKVSEIIKNGFVLNVSRFYKNEKGEPFEEISVFTVKTPNQLDSKFVGKSARVVGRLKQERFYEDDRWHSRIVVIAEHIELKGV